MFFLRGCSIVPNFKAVNNKYFIIRNRTWIRLAISRFFTSHSYVLTSGKGRIEEKRKGYDGWLILNICTFVHVGWGMSEREVNELVSLSQSNLKRLNRISWNCKVPSFFQY